MYNAGIITAGILGSGLVSEIIKAETESFQVELIEFSAYYDLFQQFLQAFFLRGLLWLKIEFIWHCTFRDLQDD